MNLKRRWEIVLHRDGRERRIQLDPVASLLATLALVLVAIGLIGLALVFGSVALIVALAVVLVALVVAIVRGAWSRLRRR
jgi:hypothetical protein